LVCRNFSKSRISRGIQTPSFIGGRKINSAREKHDSALLIGHGIINHFLAKELISKGWLGEEAPMEKSIGVTNIGNMLHIQKHNN